ncbi:substrate-binding domain-containing protein [uncultured Piscinibacter sp.]|uniref:substrate-binding domain-containing protein n=1 Tax=uncultured Piscinibacter sp. TaxID=1131835 RepID=UPI002637B0D5|nr:substrate-binding domain-containing protein [uncultured Piscinibacter sp.]
MTPRITGISSMATRALLAELAHTYEQRAGVSVAIESVGGVDAARRVQDGEAFDVVVLASDAIDKLAAAGRVLAASKVDLVHSGVAVAVRAGAPRPDIGSEAAVQRAVLAARRIGYSTGPSGTALVRLFERWGLLPQLEGRLVQARAGVPVGSLVAAGEVEIGFQQHSELIHLDGISIVGPLPPAIQIDTVFCAAVCTASRQPEAARLLLAFMSSAETADAKRRQGMDPA